jgi:phosphatidylglycerol---prolipoprotein diacylglyceryl transferase
MRSILFTIPLDGHVDLGPLGKIPVFGAGLILLLWLAVGGILLAVAARRHGLRNIPWPSVVIWVVIAAAVHELPRFVARIPVYGYGTMLFVGFLASTAAASYRIRKLGFDGEIAWDAAMWIFISGILGARLFYVVQYHERFFVKGAAPGEIFKALINLPDGGLVLYGGVIAASVGYYLFCRQRRIAPLALADLVITSVFIGLLFGRLGCLMHGCCYGDVCSLPWAVTFPQGSVPFDSLVARGYLSPDDARSLPLHPTQLYDSINALTLALLTWACYPFRRRDGQIVAMGWILYPVNRFLIEFLRSDEPGRFGTSLTISQWVSIFLLISGVAWYLWLRTRPAGCRPLVAR